jgi:NAD-dependent deacetylase
MATDRERLTPLLAEALNTPGPIVVLTGAGISAESGIPTFRGPEGYWTVGSTVYQPEEMATYRMFRKAPRAVWQWYLHRQSVCRRAQPNAGHLALVELEKQFSERFLLVTQNVDNLHLRAGQAPEKTFQIHGNLFQVRCAAECSERIAPMPAGIESAHGEPLSEDRWLQLRCPQCGDLLRPHVLWFDEYYNEIHFHWESTITAARTASLLIVVGTSGATTLPSQVVQLVYRGGGVIIDINPDDNPFGRLADSYERGFSLRMQSGRALPMVVDLLGSS